MKRLVAITVTLVLGWWGISMVRSLNSSEGALKVSVDDGEEGRSAHMTAPPPQPEVVPASVETRAPASVPSKVVTFEFQKELSSFANLQAKVLPSEDEKVEKEYLLRSERLLRGIGARLTKLPLMPIGEQDVAIDLLVEALKSGDKFAATQVMGAIVSDAQVENVSLDREVREQLAGIKAEVLYHWAALSPEDSRQIQGMLPGPASKKIWDNVTEAHRTNLAQSAEEGR